MQKLSDVVDAKTGRQVCAFCLREDGTSIRGLPIDEGFVCLVGWSDHDQIDRVARLAEAVVSGRTCAWIILVGPNASSVEDEVDALIEEELGKLRVTTTSFEFASESASLEEVQDIAYFFLDSTRPSDSWTLPVTRALLVWVGTSPPRELARSVADPAGLRAIFES